MSRRGTVTASALVIGVVASSLLLIGGLVLEFGVDAGSAAPSALLQAGILVLIATPIGRIIVLAIEFARAREYAFVMTAIGVLLFLGVSIVIGLARELR